MDTICLEHMSNQVLVCLQPRCGKQRHACVYCAEKIHRKHHLVSFKKVINICSQSFNHNSRLPQKANIIQYLNDFHSQLTENLNSALIYFNESYYSTYSKIDSYFQKILHSFNETGIDQISSGVKNIDSINQILNRRNWFNNNAFGTLQDLTVSLDAFRSQFLQERFKLTQQIRTAFDGISSLMENANLSYNKSRFIPQFAQETCGPLAKVADEPNAVTLWHCNNKDQVSLLKSPFDYVNNHCTFAIDKQTASKQNIFLGAAIESVVRKRQFHLCRQSQGGLYGWVQNGVSLNHSENSHHNKQVVNGVIFSKGGKVSIRVNYDENILQLRSTTLTQNLLQMPIIAKQTLYPCVGLVNVGDVVRIVPFIPQQFQDNDQQQSDLSDIQDFF